MVRPQRRCGATHEHGIRKDLLKPRCRFEYAKQLRPVEPRTLWAAAAIVFWMFTLHVTIVSDVIQIARRPGPPGTAEAHLSWRSPLILGFYGAGAQAGAGAAAPVLSRLMPTWADST